MSRILLLSNGHGEDLSGALVGKWLRKLHHHVDAFPLVGFGNSYTQAGIKVLGKTREFSTGGLGYTTFSGRLTELFQGQLVYLVGRFWTLLSVSSNYDLLVVIGDVVPVICAWLTRLPVVTYLVAYSSHYEGKLKLPWPCGSFLSSKRFLKIYTRDQLTADDLTIQLDRNIEFLGNPFLEPVFENQESLPSCGFRLGLLPGSRRPELDSNLLLMLSVIDLLPFPLVIEREIHFDMALVTSLTNKELKSLVSQRGWQTCNSSIQLRRNQLKVSIHRDSFVKVLQSSDVVLSMAGTAAEQALGLTKPVIQLPGNGPQFTASFAEAQRRLLGPTVFCADGIVGQGSNLRNTARLILEILERSKNDPKLHKECCEQAMKRLGPEGGARRMAVEISSLIDAMHS